MTVLLSTSLTLKRRCMISYPTDSCIFLASLPEQQKSSSTIPKPVERKRMKPKIRNKNFSADKKVVNGSPQGINVTTIGHHDLKRLV
jgi:hypothetical protein